MNASPVVVHLPLLAAPANDLLSVRVYLERIASDGTLWVRDAHDRAFACDWLQAPWHIELDAGDELVALIPRNAGRGVVVGRVGRYRSTTGNVAMDAGESLTLRCGQSSIDLRADGKVMIRGEDVLVRAKGTKRIRAGTVSIN